MQSSYLVSAELEMTFSITCIRMRRFNLVSIWTLHLIETEVIDELAIKAGVGDQVKAITERAGAR